MEDLHTGRGPNGHARAHIITGDGKCRSERVAVAAPTGRVARLVGESPGPAHFELVLIGKPERQELPRVLRKVNTVDSIHIPVSMFPSECQDAEA